MLKSDLVIVFIAIVENC